MKKKKFLKFDTNRNRLKISIGIIIITMVLELLYCNLLFKMSFHSDDAGMVFYSYRLFSGRSRFNFTHLGISYWVHYISYFFFGIAPKTICFAHMIEFLILIFLSLVISSFKMRNIYQILGIGCIWFLMFIPNDASAVEAAMLYHTNIIFCFLLMLICLEKIYEKKTSNKLIYMLLLALLFYSNMPLDALVYVIVIAPLLCILVLKCLKGIKEKTDVKREIVLFICSIGIVVLTRYINQKVNVSLSDVYTGTGIVFSNLDQIIVNFKAYVNGILWLSDAVFYNKNVLSLETIYCFIKIILLFYAVSVMYRETRKAFRGEESDTLIVYVSLASLFVSAAYILGNLYIDSGTTRYLNCIVYAVPITLCRRFCCANISWDFEKGRKYVIIVCTLIITMIHVQLFPAMEFHRAPFQEDYLSGFLMEHDLHYGFADYWIAGRTSLSSGLDVKLVPFAMEASWEPYKEWYDDKEAFFNFIVTKKTDGDSLPEIYGEPENKYEVLQYNVYVFDYDIRTAFD